MRRAGRHPRASCCARWSTRRRGDPVELAARARDALARGARRGTRRRQPAGARCASLRRSFHEARYALEVGGARRTARAPDVASWRDLGAFQLLLSVQDDEALRLYCDSVLGPIENGEGEYGGELLRSLEAFLEQNGQWEKAARELFCHRHTLRYRIRRVEQLTGRDLASARDRIEFWLALRARELVAMSECADAVAVLGAGGTIAPAIVRDLAESDGGRARCCCSTSTASARRRVGRGSTARQGARPRASTPATGSRAALDGLRRARELGQLPGQPRRDAGLPRGRLPLPRPRRPVLA